MKCVVVGAGPMGLMAARELLKRGHHVTICERDDRIGGMSASFDFDGLEIERYYHFICRTDFPLFALLDELKLADKLRWTDTKMGFFHDGKLNDWGTPFALLKFRGLDLVSKVRYALHVLSTKRTKDWTKLDRVNAVEWLKRWLGPRGYDVLWRSLFELKFYEYTDNLSAAWIGTRIKRIAESRKSLLQEQLGSLEGGSKTLLDALDADIRARGGVIRLSTPVESVETDMAGRVLAVRAGGERIACDRVLSTGPIQYVPRIAPQLPPSFIAKIESVKNIAVACVILKLKHPLSRNFWMNINDPSIEIPGVIEYSNLTRTQPAIVYAPFYMPKTNPKFARSNTELIEEVVGYLPKLNPAFSREWIIATHCHRYEFAQPICPPGFYAAMPPMKTPIDGLYMADTSYYYPEDRSISESLAVGARLVDAALA